jgi:hypothetical protein
MQNFSWARKLVENLKKNRPLKIFSFFRNIFIDTKGEVG